jgi:hypothetical protein
MMVRSRIQDLVQEKLAGKKIDPVGFIEELFHVTDQVGKLRCTLATDQQLRFEVPDQTPLDVSLDFARGKLRMLCARLGVLCQENGNPEVSPYGGEGTIEPKHRTVRFKNTPDEQEFTIVGE